MKRAAKKAARKKAAEKHIKTRPRQQDLPGMEDRSIKELENAALKYAEIRDARMGLTEQESAHKTILLGLMKKHGKQTYNSNGIEIERTMTEETVKVRVHSADEKGDKVAKKKGKGGKKSRPAPEPEPEPAGEEENHPDQSEGTEDVAAAAQG